MACEDGRPIAALSISISGSYLSQTNDCLGAVSQDARMNKVAGGPRTLAAGDSCGIVVT